MIFVKGGNEAELGPTPLVSCTQCFLRNQGYCIEVEMGVETVREGKRGVSKREQERDREIERSSVQAYFRAFKAMMRRKWWQSKVESEEKREQRARVRKETERDRAGRTLSQVCERAA